MSERLLCHRLLRGFVFAMLLSVLFPAVARAHGRLKSSVPAAGAHLAQVPRGLRLDFSEVPDLTFSTIRLQGPDGRDIPLGAIVYAVDSRRALTVPIAGAMVPGVYAIAWQMAGDDGHPVRGRIEFVVAPGAMGVGAIPSGITAIPPGTVPADTGMAGMHHDPVSMPEGNGFGAESVVYVIIRWVQFVALLLLIGAVSFHTFVLGFLHRDPRSEAQPNETALIDAADTRAARVGYAAALALIITLLARLTAQSYAMHGALSPFNPALTGPMLARTMWGWGWLLQLTGVVVAGIGLHRARVPRSVLASGSALRPNHVSWRMAGLGAVLLAFSPGLSSHAAAAPQFRLLAMLADGLHVLGASSWLGTLSIVLLAGLSTVAGDNSPRAGAFVRDLINAFSPVALVSAGIATTTGVFAAWLHVGTIPNLWSTRYGLTLLVKLSVLGIVALTGFYNWRFVQPKLGAPDATAHLKRSALVEVGVAVIVLLVTAVLVASPTSMDMVM